MTYLDLCAPLIYTKIEDLPSEINKNDDILLCYELDPAQSRDIEPVGELLIRNLLFIGHKTRDSRISPETDITLPSGKYAFFQQRIETITYKRDEWLEMAVEQQKDALWERYKLKNQLYIRYLYEDGFFVIQLFRPCLESKI